MRHRLRFLALASVMAGCVLSAQAAETDARYYTVTDTLVGSLLPQTILRGRVPFDRTYGELTAAQKDVLFQDYESLAPGDEPPFPLYGVHHVIAPLVRFADTWNPVGPLVASVEVDALGNAVSVTTYQSPDPQLTRVVGAALALEKYKPALCKGRPCAMQYVLRLDVPARQSLPIQSAAFHRYDQATGDFTRR